MKPGIYDMPAGQYHADPCPETSLSSGIAHTLLTKSPRHAWTKHRRLNVDCEDEHDKATDLGRACHMSLLDRDMSRVVFVDEKDWRKKIAQDTRDAAYVAGMVPLLRRQESDLQAMLLEATTAIAKSEIGSLDRGKAERTVIWCDNGVWCRARPDWTDEATTILDYKTTSGSAKPEAFIRGPLVSMGYDLQGAFYCRGLSLVTGAARPAYVWLVQETKAPYCCSLVGMSETLRNLADQKVERAIAVWRDCTSTGQWPGYPTQIHYAEPPTWAVWQWEEAQAMETIR